MPGVGGGAVAYPPPPAEVRGFPGPGEGVAAIANALVEPVEPIRQET